MARKIEKMYELFNREWGKRCKDCSHLSGGVNQYKKCEVYGNSASEATDWAQSYEACGMWNKPLPKGWDKPVISTMRGAVKGRDIQVPGQMSFLEV